MLSADDIMYIGHVLLQLITGLSGHMPFIMEVSAEDCDWLQHHVTGECEVIGGEQRKQQQRWNGAGELGFFFSMLHNIVT